MSLDVELIYKKEVVFEYNITHNLTNMARYAGLYYCLWRPEEYNCFKARDIINPLSCGLAILKDNPEKFKTHNAENGCGTYENLIEFVEAYLTKCKEYPNAKIKVDR